jgi:HK97 gp10 family phage protein
VTGGIKMDLKQLGVALRKKKAVINAAARPAARAGALVIYGAARENVPVSKGPHYFYGSSYKSTGQRYLFKAGTLRDSIYHAFSKDNSSNTRATYHVAWNHRKAPYGYMVEFGTSRAPAHPFLSKAIVENGEAVKAAMRSKFLEEVKKNGN